MIIAFTLAVIALFLNIMGRRRILKDDTALRGAARTAVATCPGAELVFAIIRWDRSRIGAGMCAVSLSLALPFIGELGVRIRDCPEEGAFFSRLVYVIRTTLKEQTLQANSEHREVNQAHALTAKREKLQRIRRYLADWYALLQFQEGYLCSEIPEQTLEFNLYAASYHGLLGVSKSEASELARMEAKQGEKITTQDDVGSISNR
jgi:hypothetical protein